MSCRPTHQHGHLHPDIVVGLELLELFRPFERSVVTCTRDPESFRSSVGITPGEREAVWARTFDDRVYRELLHEALLLVRVQVEVERLRERQKQEQQYGWQEGAHRNSCRG
jgi:hypothetical protein